MHNNTERGPSKAGIAGLPRVGESGRMCDKPGPHHVGPWRPQGLELCHQV